jgi:PAS domain S-box-containing protein
MMPKSSGGLRGREGRPVKPWSAAGPEDLGLDFLAAVVRSTPDGIVVLDSDCRIVYANPSACEGLGYPLDRLLGQDRLALLPEHERQTYRAFLDRARCGNSEASTVTVYRPDSFVLELEVKASVLALQGPRFFVVAEREVTERRRRAEQAAGLAQAAAGLAATDSIDALLEAISECALAGTRALAAWVTLDDEDNIAAWIGAAGVPDGFRDCLRSAVTAAATGSVYQQALTRRVVVYADARQMTERNLSMADLTDALKSLPWQAAAFAPLRHRGAFVGVLTAIYREGEMPYVAETSFLRVLAAQAATAAVNARLMAAARGKVMLEERQRLARELHDSVSQSLYAIQLGATMARERLDKDPAGVAQPIDYVRRFAEASQAEMRALIFELRPEAIETEGLVAALNRQIEAIRARHGSAVQTIASAEPELPLEVKQALLRIAREALWNMVKHARARRVDVRLEADGDSVALEIADDGVGFDPNGGFPGHLGLRSMHERAIGVGGSLQIVSARGRGTRVVVRVPSAAPSPLRGRHERRTLSSGGVSG